MSFPIRTEDTLLTRDQTATALTEEGFPVKAKTLATKATRGGGPPFRHFGPFTLYRWGDSLQWARSRLSKLVANTSELDAAMSSESPRRGQNTAGVEAVQFEQFQVTASPPSLSPTSFQQIARTPDTPQARPRGRPRKLPTAVR
jgi:hypothetical protein